MPQSKLLVDTNAYLRLARSIQPLLNVEFGQGNYCLYCIPELNVELQSRKLKSSFAWAQQSEFAGNRTKFPNVSRAQKKAIQETFDFLREHCFANNLGPSRVDVQVLAYCKELGIPVVTDDQPMRNLAKDFGIQAMSTLALLKLMLDEGHIRMPDVRSIVSYWMEMGDWPGDFTKEYRRLFREALP